MLGLLGGAFLGWGLGANDAANCFGTAVSARMIAWRRAAVIAAAFIAIGAVVGGMGGVHTLRGLTAQQVPVRRQSLSLPLQLRRSPLRRQQRDLA